jgi:hypothetical protein
MRYPALEYQPGNAAEQLSPARAAPGTPDRHSRPRAPTRQLPPADLTPTPPYQPVPLDVDAIAVTGDWVRHAPYRSSLLGRAAEPTDGRWQRGAVTRGLYLADAAATATAEWYRFLAERGLPPARAIPHDHHTWQIEAELADLSGRERLAAVGLALPRPSRRTWPPFQDVGQTSGVTAGPACSPPAPHDPNCSSCASSTTVPGRPRAASPCAPSRSPTSHPRPPE